MKARSWALILEGCSYSMESQRMKRRILEGAGARIMEVQNDKAAGTINRRAKIVLSPPVDKSNIRFLKGSLYCLLEH